MTSLLVTNDFPPKHGGIQSVLWEFWRRLPPGESTVLTTPFAGDRDWDAQQPFHVVRSHDKVLLPTPRMHRTIERLASDIAADVVFVDPMLPLGALAPTLHSAPYVVLAHGAEITGYARLPGTNLLARKVLRDAAGVVAFGSYPMRECVRAAGRPLPGVVVPPGVDTKRFHPLSDDERRDARRRFALDLDRPVVLGLSRLVPRKGFDVLITAVAGLRRNVQLAIAGGGRDRERLRRLARGLGITVEFLGRVDDCDLPALYGCADVFAMPCRADRWGGIEAEGFGIVFLEAAACGVPQIAGRSGGSHEAVAHEETGLVVDPRFVPAVRHALTRLLDDADLRRRMGEAARKRAVEQFCYDDLVRRLEPIAAGKLGSFTDQGLGATLS
ncbi:MAG TPA: glycosyltransferase family 4 protein [Acidimicrobiia bacterium]|jgi:phosphatidylinositol alpha-1,6-mannosyltransferase